MTELRHISILFFIFLCTTLIGQEAKRIQLLGADVIEYDASIVNAQRLLGNVSFAHEGTKMYCDSAWLYESDNDLKAFGHVRIVQPPAPNGETKSAISIKADSLYYNGNDRKALMYDNIVLRDGEMTLTTDYLTYTIDQRLGTYIGGGKIVSSKNRNVLTSEIGHYFANGRVFHFKTDVVLTNPQYVITTDTLHYHSFVEQSYFLGPTEIKGKKDLIYCENGWYDSKNDIAQFEDNAYIWSNGQQLKGDSLYYNRNGAYGEAFENVALIDTTNSISIFGEYGKYLEDEDIGIVTDSALMQQYFSNDTLNLHADTLMAMPDPLDSLTKKSRAIRAFHDVRIFKTDMQGSCDSLTYSEMDSLIVMYDDPIVWSQENQISGARISLKTANGSIDRLNTYNDAFIISEVDTLHYNQIKGKDLVGYFRDNELYKVWIEGNGQSIYFAEELKDSVSTILGVNKSECSTIMIHIKDSEIERVNFITQPESAFYPLSKLSAPEMQLADFKWEEDRRPLSLADLFTPRPAEEDDVEAMPSSNSALPSETDVPSEIIPSEDE